MTLLLTLGSCLETADKTNDVAVETQGALREAADQVKDAAEEV